MAVTAARRAVAAAAAFSAVAALAQASDHGRLAAFDRRAFEAVRAHRRPGPIMVARAVSALAEPRVVYPMLALAGIRAARHGGWWQVGVPCATVVGGAAVRRRLSRVVARERPPAEAWLIEPEGYSLPSKHTTLAVLAVGASVRAAGKRGAPAQAATLLAAACIGVSRVYLGVHWPADVVAGWLFAEGWLKLTYPD
jgi:membrane-associated phospholipid phosphatase